MIIYIISKILVFICEVINVTNEKEMIEKYASINLNETNENDSRAYLINDYCNIGHTQIINQFFLNVFEYFNSSIIKSDECIILDNIFNIYNLIKYYNLTKNLSFILLVHYVTRILNQFHY